MLYLEVPYRSQLGPDAGLFRNDCGPAALAMWLEGFGKTLRVDALHKDMTNGVDRYTYMSDIIRVAKANGLSIVAQYGDLPTLRGLVDGGKGYIALVHYGTWSSRGMTESRFTGGHWVNVVGYDDDNIIIHDPLFSGEAGKYRKIPNELFHQAWLECGIDHNPKFYGAIVQHIYPHVGTIPVPQPPTPMPGLYGMGHLRGHQTLRMTPNYGTRIGYCTAGTTVEILEAPVDGWYHVRWTEKGVLKEGWIGGQYLTVTIAPTTEPQPPVTNKPLFNEATDDEKWAIVRQLAIAGGLLDSEGRIL